MKPYDKYKKLRKYITDGDYVYRKVIEAFGFKEVEKTLYNYCTRNKLKLRKINDDYWVKDYDAILIDILLPKDRRKKTLIARLSNKRARARNKEKRRLIHRTINLPN